MRLLSMSISYKAWPIPRLLMAQRVLLGLLSLVLGCQTESSKPEAIPDDDELYWGLELNHHAVTLGAPGSGYDTLRLVATPRNYLGGALPGFPAPTYRSEDIERVAVTADGMVVAVALTGQPVRVIATLAAGNLKHADTVVIQVQNQPTPPVVASFSIDPVPPDTAKVGLGFGAAIDGLGSGPNIQGSLPIQATAADDTPIAGLLVHFRVSDPTIATVASGTANVGLSGGTTKVLPLRYGAVTIYASLTAYGVTKADTLAYQVGRAVWAELKTGNPTRGENLGLFTLPDLKVGTGAVVVWARPDMDPAGPQQGLADVDVTFAPADVPAVIAPTPPFLGSSFTPLFCPTMGDCSNGGNFVLNGVTKFAMRAFPVPGTYEYRSTIHGTTGRIVVAND